MAPTFRHPNCTSVSWSAVFLSQLHLLCWQEVQCSCSATILLCHFVRPLKLLLFCSYSTRKHGFPIDPVFYLPAPQENLGYLKQCWRTMFRQTYHFSWTTNALTTLRVSKVLVLNSQFNDLKTLSLASTGMKTKLWALGWRVPTQIKAWKSLVSSEVGCSSNTVPEIMSSFTARLVRENLSCVPTWA